MIWEHNSIMIKMGLILSRHPKSRIKSGLKMVQKEEKT